MTDEVLAAQVRNQCLAVLIAAYEEAGLLGLCHEGRWEYALDQLRHTDPKRLLQGEAHQAGVGD